MNATASVDQSPDRPAERTITVIGFGQRLVAAVIDAFIVVVLSLILGAIASFVIQAANSMPPHAKIRGGDSTRRLFRTKLPVISSAVHMRTA